MRKFIDGTHRGAMITAIMSGETPNELVAQIRTADYDGADGIAIDLAHLRPEFRNVNNLKQIIASSNIMPFMFYFYRNDPWKQYQTDDARQELLLMAVDAGAHIVDVMGDLYNPSPRERTYDAAAIDKQMALIETIHSRGSQVVMSSHMNEFLTTEEVLEQMREFDRRGADVLKLVQAVNSDHELAVAIETTMTLRRELTKPFIHLCNGSHSRLHRFLGPSLGVSICFANASYDPRWPYTQPTVKGMNTVFDTLRFHIDDVKRG